MKNSLFIALLALMAFVAAGCSNAPKETPEDKGFLENYDLLQQVPSPEDSQFFTYENPKINQDNYDAVIIEPLYVFEDVNHESSVTRENIEKAKVGIDVGLDRIIREKYDVVHAPGPSVMRLRVAITGAHLQGEGFKVWNIIPVSAAITLASKATDLDRKKAVLVVELKFTDSQTGALIKETVTTISGDNFRNESKSNISAQYEKLAEMWAEQALPIL